MWRYKCSATAHIGQTKQKVPASWSNAKDASNEYVAMERRKNKVETKTTPLLVECLMVGCGAQGQVEIEAQCYRHRIGVALVASIRLGLSSRRLNGNVLIPGIQECNLMQGMG